MKELTLDELASLGLGWRSNGQAVLSGPLLEWSDALDRTFVELARTWRAREYRFPAFIPAAELDRLDYFRSFPHLVSFPVALDAAEENLERFTRGPVFSEGRMQLTDLAPLRDALTPAACYHVYIELQRSAFTGARYYTTKNTCFRREQYFSPLQRQSAFAMREIVCVGSLGEVRAFLETVRTQVASLLAAVGLPVSWDHATDPFFQPAKNTKYLGQLASPVKTEAVYGGQLAIASLNLHQDHFGRTFEISARGEPAYTGCVAFGLERWLYAIVAEHGTSPAKWPKPPHVRADAAEATRSMLYAEEAP
jgi:hypothetical protein